MAIDRKTLTVEEAADLLGISRNSGYAAARRGELRAIRIGKRFVIPRSAVEAILGEKLNLAQEQTVGVA